MANVLAITLSYRFMSRFAILVEGFLLKRSWPPSTSNRRFDLPFQPAVKPAQQQHRFKSPYLTDIDRLPVIFDYMPSASSVSAFMNAGS